MQNDFCHRDGAACKRGRDMAFVENMIPRLINFVNRARAQGFPICFVRTPATHGRIHRFGRSSKIPNYSPAPTALGVLSFTKA